MANHEDGEDLAEDQKEASSVFQSFLEKHHAKEIENILQSDNLIEHYSLTVNALDFFDINMHIGQFILKKPLDFLPVFDDAVREVQATVMGGHPLKATMSVKENVHVRISNLPVCSELTRVSIPKSADVGNFLAISGTLIRTSLSKLLEFEKEYMCKKCKHVFKVQADFQQYYTLPKPMSCPSPEPCNSIKFACVDSADKNAHCYKDYQEIKIQEQVQKLAVGTIPRSMWVCLEDDLVDTCKPGDDVTVYGTVMRRWRPLYKDSKCGIELALKANNLIVNNDQRSSIALTEDIKREFEEFWEHHKHHPLRGRNEILASFCPQVFGLYVVKLSVTLVLIGGVQKISESGTRVRGESHMLMVGDPGTGKSQFLKYSAKLMPRSVLTTGIGSTGAGLTVTAVKDSGEWQLEAGALVLADGGLCCIDEFNSIKEHDKASIHEAMEQQTISVAKAGLVCKLNTRSTILAATNPKGNYDREESVSVNVALASPLLSRFDVVLVLLDNRNEEWERIISSFVLRGSRPGFDANKVKKELWSIDKMQAYICYVKTIKPTLTPDSNRVLCSYYTAQRSADSRNAARTTIRLLESMVRIAQAHARLLYKDKVTVLDAIVAVCITESSMQNTALFGKGLNPLHTVFPKDPDAEYIKQAKIVLTKLRLHDILQRVLEEEEERRTKIAENEVFNNNTNTEEPVGDQNRNSNEEKAADENNENSTGISGRREELENETPAPISLPTPNLASGFLDREDLLHSTPLLGPDNFPQETPIISHRNRDFQSTSDSSSGPETLVGALKETPLKLLETEGSIPEYHRSNFNHFPNIFDIGEDIDDFIEHEWPFSGDCQNTPTYPLHRRHNESSKNIEAHSLGLANLTKSESMAEPDRPSIVSQHANDSRINEQGTNCLVKYSTGESFTKSNSSACSIFSQSSETSRKNEQGAHFSSSIPEYSSSESFIKSTKISNSSSGLSQNIETLKNDEQGGLSSSGFSEYATGRSFVKRKDSSNLSSSSRISQNSNNSQISKSTSFSTQINSTTNETDNKFRRFQFKRPNAEFAAESKAKRIKE